MIQSADEVERMLAAYDRLHSLTLDQKYRILDALYEEARQRNHFSDADALAGLQEKIERIRRMHENLRRTTGETRNST